MSQATTLPGSRSPQPLVEALLTALFALLAAHRPAFAQDRTYQRHLALVLGQLLAFARHTLAQGLIAVGLVGPGWVAYYRLFSVPRLDKDRLAHCFFQETLAHVPPDQPFAVGVDGVQLPRSSLTMPGTSWLKAPRTPPWKPGIHRAQRFVHTAWLPAPSPQGYTRAIPLRWDPAFPPKAVLPAGQEPRKEWEAARDSLQGLRQHLDQAGRSAQRLLAVGDRAYETASLWRALPHDTTLLARTAKNRALFHLPPPSGGKGPRRLYGAQAPHPQEELRERAGWQHATVPVRGRAIPLTYRVTGPSLVRTAPAQPVYLLTVRGVARGRGRRRDPAFWLVNAVPGAEGGWVLPLPAEALLAWAWQRWEVEVAHREMKAGLGVGQIQCWGATSAVLAPQWQVWVYGVLVLAGYRAWGLERGPVPPPGRWWGGSGRWSFGQLWQGYRQALWGAAAFRPVWSGTGANPRATPDWEAALRNAVQGARRA